LDVTALSLTRQHEEIPLRIRLGREEGDCNVKRVEIQVITLTRRTRGTIIGDASKASFAVLSGPERKNDGAGEFSLELSKEVKHDDVIKEDGEPFKRSPDIPQWRHEELIMRRQPTMLSTRRIRTELITSFFSFWRTDELAICRFGAKNLFAIAGNISVSQYWSVSVGGTSAESPKKVLSKIKEIVRRYSVSSLGDIDWGGTHRHAPRMRCLMALAAISVARRTYAQSKKIKKIFWMVEKILLGCDDEGSEHKQTSNIAN
jgi:hypothetical protein